MNNNSKKAFKHVNVKNLNVSNYIVSVYTLKLIVGHNASASIAIMLIIIMSKEMK